VRTASLAFSTCCLLNSTTIEVGGGLVGVGFVVGVVGFVVGRVGLLVGVVGRGGLLECEVDGWLTGGRGTDVGRDVGAVVGVATEPDRPPATGVPAEPERTGTTPRPPVPLPAGRRTKGLRGALGVGSLMAWTLPGTPGTSPVMADPRPPSPVLPNPKTAAPTSAAEETAAIAAAGPLERTLSVRPASFAVRRSAVMTIAPGGVFEVVTERHICAFVT
jgi:hypothetical protein